jgi:DNA invertase Pin-like site-specific DNA recombinase
MIVGYARTSTVDQVAGLDAQVRDLTAAGCERIFSEQISSVGDRPQLTASLDFVREGDVFVCTKVDRLARSIGNLFDIIERLQAKGVELRIANLGLDTSTATGKLMLTLIGGIAAFEREMMLERQREGIAVARAAGHYKGRAPTVRKQLPEIKRLLAAGLGVASVAKKLGVGRATIYRLLGPAQPRLDLREAAG